MRLPGRSTTRGSGLPVRSSRVIVLVTKAPEAIEIHDPIEALRECAGRGHDRIAQCQAANSHRQINSDRGAHGNASMRSNTGPSQQTRRCTISPSTLKSRTQQKQRPEAACHLLLHRDLTGQTEFARQSLLHPHQPARAACEERFATAFRNQAAENAFDIRRSACRFRNPLPRSLRRHACEKDRRTRLARDAAR